MHRLEGRVAVVTGTAQGIGRAIAVAFAREGASVAGVDLNGEGAAAAAAEIEALGVQGRAHAVDVADGEAMRAVIDETAATLGRLDILCNNVAAFEREIHATDTDAEAIPIETWDRTMDVNLRGPLLASKYALAHFRRGGGGVILNISSAAAFNGDVVHVAYGASKAGLHQLTRAIATSHGRFGMHANVIATGLVMSETAQANPSETLTAWGRHRLVAQPGTPDEVAAMAVHLCSDDSRYVTGQTIVMDGGASTVHQPWYVDSGILHPDVVGPDFLSGAGAPPATH